MRHPGRLIEILIVCLVQAFYIAELFTHSSDTQQEFEEPN